MEQRDLQAQIRGIVNQIAVRIRHYPHNHDELRELVVKLLELMDGD